MVHVKNIKQKNNTKCFYIRMNILNFASANKNKFK